MPLRVLRRAFLERIQSDPAAWGGMGLGVRPIAGRGRSNFLGCYLDAHVSGASVGVHGIESTWVPAVEIAQVAVNWLWIYLGLLLESLLAGPPNWWDIFTKYPANVFLYYRPV